MSQARLQVMFVAMCLIWGSTWIAAKTAIAVVPPVLFVGTRFFVAGVLMLAWCWRDLAGIRRADLPRLAALVVLMVAAPYALLFWGALYVSSGLAAILDLSFMPVALLAIGALLGEERFTRLRLLGAAVGVTGLCLLFGPKAWLRQGGDVMALWGGLAIVVSALIYALGSVLARPLLRRTPPALLAAVTMSAGGVVLVGAAVVLEPGAAAALGGAWGRPAWIAWVFLVLFGSIVATTIYLLLVREWGPARAGAYAFVSPAIAALLGIAAFHEVVGPLDALGMATMLAGAWLTVRPVAPA